MAYTINLDPAVYEKLRNHCVETRKAGRSLTADEMINELMDFEEIPMHHPYHHFIMPAALLTLASLEEQVSPEALNDLLMTAEARAKQVPGGFCGNCGSCGNGVGAGIFLSVYTDTSPMSTKSWQWVNELTGRCLMAIAKVQGPRCCKRTAYLSLQESVPYINETLGLHLAVNREIICKYHEQNSDCKREACPFYRAEGTSR
ncbi:MAG: DUF5714 domain-containing protein [Lachnospiraceae bacterium]|jgi:hypothetical protein|nr:DUF5714 domain-containing protein [Lachnospiraceae bacterium]